MKKLKQRQGIVLAMALGALFIWVGAYFAHEGFAHHGPGWWTFGDEDTDKFSEKLPEARYKRQCYGSAVIFLLVGAFISRDAVKKWRERDDLEEAWMRIADDLPKLADIQKRPEIYRDDMRQWLRAEGFLTSPPASPPSQKPTD